MLIIRWAARTATLAFIAFAPQRTPQEIPLRTLVPDAATDSGAITSIAGVRQLHGGRVLVNDATRRRLLIFDSTLKQFTVVADTTPGSRKAYGNQPGALIPFFGDSTLFVDTESRAFVVLDAAGRMARTIAPPKPSDLVYMTSALYGEPGLDPRGRLIYRTVRLPRPDAPPPPENASGSYVFAWPDSVPILRSDFDTRAVDTIAMMRIPVQRVARSRLPDGRSVGTVQLNPLPETDEWALLSDGTIAIVRGYDYHIDWIRPDGTKQSSAKLPFAWKRVALEDKQRMLDSIRNAYEEARAKIPPPAPLPGRPAQVRVPYATVEVSDLPDYYPPIRQGQVKADRDGNLWILPTTSTLASGGLVFDVVNTKGDVTMHVRLPEGRNLAGFGAGGIVYMSSTPSSGEARLERARLSR